LFENPALKKLMWNSNFFELLLLKFNHFLQSKKKKHQIGKTQAKKAYLFWNDINKILEAPKSIF